MLAPARHLAAPPARPTDSKIRHIADGVNSWSSGCGARPHPRHVVTGGVSHLRRVGVSLLKHHLHVGRHSVLLVRAAGDWCYCDLNGREVPCLDDASSRRLLTHKCKPGVAHQRRRSHVPLAGAGHPCRKWTLTLQFPLAPAWSCPLQCPPC
jgi:hypothetical protein